MKKYYADLYDDSFEILDTENHDTVYCGKFTDIGIEDNDPDFTNKMDRFLETELGIAPNEWEIG